MKKTIHTLFATGIFAFGLILTACADTYTETQNLNDNQVPAGWFIAKSTGLGINSGITNGHLFANPTDSGVTLYRPLNFSNPITSIKIQWRGWMQPSYWGLRNYAGIGRSNGDNYIVGAKVSQYLFGNDFVAWLPEGSELSPSARRTAESGIFRYMFLLEQGRCSFEIRRDSDGSLFAAGQTNDINMTLTSVTNVYFGVNCTTDASSWIDDLQLTIELNSVDLKMFAGLVINEPIGSNYLIQARSSLTSSNWTTLTNVAIPTQPYIYIDYNSYTNSQQFYRAVPQ